MAYFAVISSDNIVQNIYDVNDEYIAENFPSADEGELISNFSSWCEDGQYIVQYFTDGRRQRPAMIGGTYDPVEDKFTDVKPSKFPSWVLDYGKWVPPVARPNDIAPGWSELHPTKGWFWNEETISWITIPPQSEQ